MPRTISVGERRARLARRHLLHPSGRTDDVAEIADAVVALHSTDPVTVYLSALARMRHPDVTAVEAALYVERSVFRHHAMRRTLWVATPEVVRLMHAAATRRLVGPEHRRTAKLLGENGIDDPDAWLADARERVLAALHEHGPMTARSLGVEVPALTHKVVMAPGKKYSARVSAHTRVLLQLGFEGQVIRTRPTGTWINGAYTYAALDSWLPGGLGELGEREAARDLALRWLCTFGPGTAADLQWWAGWTTRTTRDALADCGAVEVAVAEGAAYVAPGDDTAVRAPGPWVALLPGLDPTTMGWKERDWYLPAACAATFDRMGNAGPTIWVDGAVVGAWDQAPDGSIRTHYCVDVPAARRAEVEGRAAEVAGWLGDVRYTVRFPSPLSTALRQQTDPAV
ncbi:MAG: winged helix DNA-binding domain-containing protein [Nocardioidaceae bacterium]|nr:winged helix DNA-binding domain-containing protein [Nocardioidaceae bacterium]NUS51822.1 winged helix DNA-binding domain-containing protein [Nocardioidaceae bacterium]